MNIVTIKTFDKRLHFFYNVSTNDVVSFLEKKGMLKVNEPCNNNEFKVIK